MKGDQQTREEMMNLMRDALYDFGDMELLSNRTGLSMGTLYAIRRGKTKWPRWTTFETLMEPLGLRLELRRYGNATR